MSNPAGTCPRRDTETSEVAPLDKTFLWDADNEHAYPPISFCRVSCLRRDGHGQTPEGRMSFQNRCAVCHGADANGGEHAPSILARLQTGIIESLPEDHSPACGQPLDARRRNHSRLELHPFFEKSRCATTSSRCSSCRRRPTDPQRLGRGATLPGCDLPETPPLPQPTSALSPSITHEIPRTRPFRNEPFT